MLPSFGQIVQFFPGATDRSGPWVGIVTRAYGDDGYNYVDLIAVCPKSGGTTPLFLVPRNSNDDADGPFWVALQDAAGPQTG